MLWLLCKLSISKEYRNKYPSLFSWMGQLISELALLTIYWYTAKAFVPNLHVLSAGTDYFSFVVVGESVLLAPSLMITSLARIFRSDIQQQTFEPTLLSSASLTTSWLVQSFGAMIVEGLRLLLVLILAITFFHFNIAPIPNLILVLVLQVLALPLFAGLGLVGVSVMMVLGRGERILPFLTTGMTVLAGAYFPIEVLPSIMQTYLRKISPMNILLESSREAIQFGWSSPQWLQSAIFLLFGSVVFLMLGILSVSLSTRYYRQRSQPILILS